MSTSPVIQVEETVAWKQEVSRKLAAHKSHQGAAAAERQAGPEARAGRRATEAAARVAARFAKAPSYSQVLADEARAAVRAAEAASQAARHAQAAAESVLASLEADLRTAHETPPAATEGSAPGKAAYAAGAVPERTQPAAGSSDSFVFSTSWELNFPERPSAADAERQEAQPVDEGAGPADGWREPLPGFSGTGIEMVEAVQPLHANLIEFPRELVAARKARPRLAESPYAAAMEPSAQLSIFEVDPAIVPAEPAAIEGVAATVEPVWTGPEWSGIELSEAAEIADVVEDEPAPYAAAGPQLEPASMSRRALAAVVDGSLIGAAFLAAAMTAASNAKGIPGLRVVEAAATTALLLIGAIYLVLFHTLAVATPGMRYARIGLSTLSGGRPTRAERWNRLGALLLSLLPVGLGVVWSIFDDAHLSWHDRLSGTYLRKE